MDDNDFRTAELFIQYLSRAPLDHHSRDIMEIMPKLIEKKLPSLIEYLDARIIQTPQLEKIDRGSIIPYSNSVEVGIMKCSIWENPETIKQVLFGKEQRGTKNIDSEVELKLVDLPFLHQMSLGSCLQFFEALKDLKEVKDTDGFDIFELKSIRLLIEYHWPLTKEYTIKKLLIPFIVYLAAFWIYTNFIDSLGDYLDSVNLWPWVINLTILVLLSLYFLRNEAKQIRYSGMSYFRDPWNYIDLTPPIFVITIAILNFVGV